jgi:hypothetical protein
MNGLFSLRCIHVPFIAMYLPTVYLTLFKVLIQRFSNCGPRTTGGPRVLPLWSS